MVVYIQGNSSVLGPEHSIADVTCDPRSDDLLLNASCTMSMALYRREHPCLEHGNGDFRGCTAISVF